MLILLWLLKVKSCTEGGLHLISQACMSSICSLFKSQTCFFLKTNSMVEQKKNEMWLLFIFYAKYIAIQWPIRLKPLNMKFDLCWLISENRQGGSRRLEQQVQQNPWWDDKLEANVPVYAELDLPNVLHFLLI